MLKYKPQLQAALLAVVSRSTTNLSHGIGFPGYQLGQELGTGAFGTVYSCHGRYGIHDVCAVKVVRTATQTQAAQMQLEIMAMRECRALSAHTSSNCWNQRSVVVGHCCERSFASVTSASFACNGNPCVPLRGN